jgi:hypothetical protein
MKNLFLPLGIISIAMLFAVNVLAQQKTYNLYYTDAIITIDGYGADWIPISPVGIDEVFQAETPTLNSATWKAAWNDDGIYVLVEVDDDVWSPSWVSGSADSLSDKIEVYFDVSTPQRDGRGASTGLGNYQLAPDYPNPENASNPHEQGVAFNFIPGGVWPATGIMVAGKYDGNGYSCMEYFVPFADLTNEKGDAYDPFVKCIMGFDVCVVDNDVSPAARNRLVWSNTGKIDESLNNCDDVGLIASGDCYMHSIDEIAKNNVLKSNIVYDNLFFNVSISQVSVFDIMGKLVKMAAVSENKLNVSDLMNGIYILTAHTANGQIVAGQFVKQ